VKYCGLVRPQDVDAAVAIGADAIGFVFYSRSPRLLDVEAAVSLRRRLPSWVTAVGLFVNEPVALIEPLARRVGLDAIQLHGDETPSQAQALQIPWWKAIRVGAGSVPEPGGARDDQASAAPRPAKAGESGEAGEAGEVGEATRQSLARALEAFAGAEYCLLDSLSAGYGGSGRTFDWTLVPEGAGPRLIVSGGLDAANVGAAVGSLRPFAVDTSSGIQSEDPRRKDVGRMEQFMEAVRRADGRP
jgi:phosphoribosylanthranilate isomerase